MGTKILLWNARSITKKKAELTATMVNKNVDVAIITETWLTPNTTFKINNYNCIRQDREDGRKGGGCVILVKNSIPFAEINRNIAIPGTERVMVKIRDLNIIGMYNPPGNQLDDKALRDLINQVQGTVLLAGDFNALSTVWGCTRTNRNGENLREVIEDLELRCINKDSITSSCGGVRNNLDLFISTRNIAEKAKVEVLEDNLSSDHIPIILSMTQMIDRGADKRKYMLRRRNINKFNENSFAEFWSSLSEEKLSWEPDKLVKEYLNCHHTLFDTKRARDHKAPVWWNNDCEEAVRKRKNALRKFKQGGSLENFIALKREAARATRITQNAKKSSWREMCSNITRECNPTVPWSFVKKCRKANNIQWNLANTFWEWDQEFLEKYTPDQVAVNLGHNEGYERGKVNTLSEDLTKEEVLYALDRKTSKSAGPDEITYQMIKIIMDRQPKYLVNQFNKVIQTGSIPPTWKKSFLIPIPKANAQNKTKNCDKFRPIVLDSCTKKVFEGMMKRRLTHWLAFYNKLPRNQFAFQAGRCAEDCLAILIGDMLTAKYKNLNSVVVSVDIRGAYDAVQPNMLAKKLCKIGIPRDTTSLLLNLLTDRGLRTRITPNWRYTSTGLPQGSALSPLLFSLCLKELDNILEGTCKILLFADDITLYHSEVNVTDCENRIQDGLNILGNWLRENGFEVEPEKSKCLLLTTKARNRRPLRLRLEGKEINNGSELKILGLNIDGNLKLNSHWNTVHGKCMKDLNILKSACGKKWGADPTILRQLYYGYIRSKMDYASWCTNLANNRVKKRLDSIQNQAMRIIGGFFCSTPIAAMEKELNTMPLKLRRLRYALNFILNRMYIKDHPVIRIIAGLAEKRQGRNSPELIEAYGILKRFNNVIFTTPKPLETLQHRKVMFFSPQYTNGEKVPKGPNGHTIAFDFHERTITLEDEEVITIFTDGSKSPQKDFAGFAVWIPKLKIEKKCAVDKNASIFTLEALAIREALICVREYKISKGVIFTDAYSVVQSLTGKPGNKSWVIYAIKALWYDIQQNGKIIMLSWIKGHSGIIQNDRADLAAKSACEGPLSRRYLIPHSDLKRFNKEHVKEQWHQDWVNRNRTHRTNLYRIMPPSKWEIWFMKYRYNRREIVTINRIRANHGQFPEHMHKLNMINSDKCEECDETSDINHIIFKCTKYDRHRENFLAFLRLKKHPLPTSINALVYKPKPDLVKVLCKFLDSIGIRI